MVGKRYLTAAGGGGSVCLFSLLPRCFYNNFFFYSLSKHQVKAHTHKNLFDTLDVPLQNFPPQSSIYIRKKYRSSEVCV